MTLTRNSSVLSSRPSTDGTSMSSITSKVKGLKNLFASNPNSHGSETSTKSSIHSMELADIPSMSSSEDEDRSDGRSGYDTQGPICFKALTTFPFRKVGSSAGVAGGSSSILNDDDYTAYLKKPKYIKTVKKADHTAGICQRLFLAQELDQSHDEQLLDVAPQESNQKEIEFRLAEEYEAQASMAKTLASDSMGGQNVKARDKQDRKSIWALTFSKDGKYLASAGKGNDIKIWKVLSSPLDRLSLPKMRDDKVMYGSVFLPAPVKVFRGHSNDILSLDWSKNNFLLSSSMDKTVKLWNLKSNSPLRSFEHDDFVTCVKFHPLDDRFFLSGCLDQKVRLWSILDNEMSYSFDAKNLVTAIGFTPNGNLTIVGTFTGAVFFLDTSNLELRHSIQLSKKTANQGAKITGIETFIENDDIKIVITSNDSRVRMVSLRHRQLEYFFKGPENTSSQVIATVSDDHKYLISGSEDHWVYIWDNSPGAVHKRGLLSNKKKRSDYTAFHAHHSVVTCSLIAPTSTLKTLSLSNDLIYELNSELIKNGLVSKDPKTRKVKRCKAQDSTPTSPQERTDASYADSIGANRTDTSLFEQEFIGSIIVTADDLGFIRIFRQDLTSAARDALLEHYSGQGNGGKSKPKKGPSLDIPTDSNHRIFMNKNHNNSNSSLLTKSFNSNGNLSELSATRNRSRSGTLDSITKMFPGGSNAISEGATRTRNNTATLICDVCGGDKFQATKVVGSVGSPDTGVGLFCSDCGNQIHIPGHIN